MASVGVQVGIQGAAEYRKAMSEMTSSTKLFQAQSKNIQSQLGKSVFSRSIEESKLLSKELETLKQKSALLEGQIAEATEKYGANSTQVNRLRTQYENLQTQINRVDAELREHGGLLGAVGAQMEAVGDKMKEVGQNIANVGDKLTTSITTPLLGIGVASVKAFSDWESAFTGVMKTVDETANTTYADIAKGIKKMATETASTKEEIAAVAEAAGQLGVKADDILNFTKTMVMLGDTTNLSAEDAASALAKFMNITGESQEDVDRIGSSIVALGNNFATTEADIVEMSTRLASAGTIAGLSSTDILALSAAMSSVGINAEAGGTAMSQTLASLEKNVTNFRAGAENDLDKIAQVSGISAEDFARTWENAPIIAIQNFIKGLGNLDEQGESATLVLDELGMSGIRQSNMLKSLGLASGELSRAVGMSNTAYQENSALVTEAELRYNTFESKLNQTKEAISNVGIEIGERLLPYVDQMISYIDTLIAKWDSLTPEMQNTVIQTAMLVAALGPILSVGGRLIAGTGQIVSMVGKLVEFLPTLGTAIAGITAPILAVVAAVGAFVGAFVYLYNTNEEFKNTVVTTWTAIQNFISMALSNIQEFWNAHGEQIKAAVQVFWEIIMNFFNTYLTTIMQVVQFWMAVFQGDWSGAWEIVKSIYTNIWEGIKTHFSIVLNAMKAVFSTIFNAIKAKVVEIFNNIKTTIMTTLASVVSTIQTKLNSAHQLFTTFKENVKATIQNLINSALHWGSDMIENFKNGITSKMQGVLDSVRNMAQSIKDMMHFSEPDKGPLKNFNDWAPDMMRQYAEGIENGRYLVQRAVSDVTADVAMMQPDILTADEIYSAVNAGASDANISIVIGDRELGRALRNMGVVMA